MGVIKAYGEATIVDLTDTRKLSTYITSNQPTTVIYDPNSAVKYTPNWATNNLVLTPTIFLDTEQQSPTGTNITVSWQRKVGSEAATALKTGETVKNGILTVSNNMMEGISSGLLTYICTVTYHDPDTNRDVTAQSQISYALVKNATELKDATISGENIFKYNGDGSNSGVDTITLTADLTNVTMKGWQYKNSNGGWSAYPNATTATTLTVKRTDNVFVNNTAIIKVVTDDSTIYDLHQITKLYDGAAGNDVYTCILSNDTQSVPCKKNGDLYPTSLTGCDTTVTIYKGGKDDTANWGITATPSTGVSGTYNKVNHNYTVSGITVDSGYVEFIATKSGNASIAKRFSINKDRSGADGENAVIYQINSDVFVMKRDKSNVLSPANGVTFSATKTEGNGTPTAYSGILKIYESTDGATYGDAVYTSSKDEASYTIKPSSASVKTIKCELYASGGAGSPIDTQTVSIVFDGTNGQDGKPGSDAVNVILGNSSEVIPCNNNGTVKYEKSITITFSCYKGTSRIAGTISVQQNDLNTLGISVKSNTPATNSADGVLVLTVPAGCTLGGAESGDISLLITANSLTSTHKFSWTKNIQSKDGQNAVMLQIYPDGKSLIENSSNSVKLATLLTDGTSKVESGVTYQWQQYVNGEYTDISGQKDSTLTVTPSMVDSLGLFACKAHYNNEDYMAYASVVDRSDPASVEVYCSVGDQFVNGVGVGAMYALVYQNGKELDPIKTTYFSETAPSNPKSGDYYYKITAATSSVAGSVMLMKYNGSSWVTATSEDAPKGTYKWTRRDKKGIPLDTGAPYASGKVIYVDKNVVDTKITLGCDVSIDL